MINLRKEKLELRKENELNRFENKLKKAMEVELHNLTSKRKRKMPTYSEKTKRKKKALSEFQKFAKLSRAYVNNNKICVVLMDKMKEVELSWNVHWWHCFPQWNYPQLAFDIDNCRPISWWWNRQQLDTVGLRLENLKPSIQDYLKDKSENKQEKRSDRDSDFYIEKYNQYKILNKRECERLWISYK